MTRATCCNSSGSMLTPSGDLQGHALADVDRQLHGEAQALERHERKKRLR